MAPLFGFDRDGHLEYVDYILKNQRLPLADEGWQMYQPPFFYLISALILSPFGANPFDDSAVTALRSLSALTGLATAFLAYLALRLLFASRPWLPVLGLFFVTMLPMNVGLSHHVTNEMLSGLLVTASLYFSLRILQLKGSPVFMSLAVGVSLGLALLTKFSAILAIPLVMISLAWHFWRTYPAPRCFGLLAILLGSLLLVSAWHYVQVWNKFGNPLIGNWDTSLPYKWWQEPGYRTMAWYSRFGDCLTSPLFSGFNSLADGLYSTLWGDGLCSGSARISFRPPWNYDLMNCAILAAIPVSAFLLYGFFVALVHLFRNPTPEWFLLLSLFLVFVFGLTWMTLQVGSYAQAKAFYAMPALLPLAALVVVGCDRCAHNSRRAKQLVAICLLSWGALAYSSFWIRSGNPATFESRGQSLLNLRRYADAQKQFSQALSLDPSFLPAQLGTADAALNLGNPDEARRTLESARQNHPDSGEANRLLGVTLLTLQTNSAEAFELVTQAAKIEPDQPLVHQQTARVLLQLARFEEATRACKEGLRVNPFSPELYFLWATACLELNELSNVVSHLNVALRLKPDWADASASLSLALVSLGNLEQATAQYSKTIALRPNDPLLHYQYALLLAQKGDFLQASQQYHSALDLKPDFIEALNNLAWILAANPNPEVRNGTQAVTLAERACQLTSYSEPVLLGTLAAGYAEAGRFNDAVTTAEKAQQTAKARGNTQLMEKNQQLLELYKTGKAYHENSN